LRSRSITISPRGQAERRAGGLVRPRAGGGALQRDRHRAPRAHPNAALLFYDYMITEAQQYFVSLDYVPTNTSVSSPLKSLRFKLVDPVQVLDQMDNWTQVFQEVVVRRAGP